MKLTNLQAAIATRARQIAAGAIKQTAIDRGCKFADFRISEHRKAIEEASTRADIVAKATADIAEWTRKNGRKNTV